MLKQILFRSLLGLGIAANIAFLLINLRPERPRFGIATHLKVLLRAEPARAKWVKENMLDVFAAQHNIVVDVVTAKSFEEVLTILKKEKQHPTGLTLAAINDQLAGELQQAGVLRPIHELVPAEDLDAALSDYLPEALSRCRGLDGKIWYLPKRAQMDVAVYLRAAVEDVYLHWNVERAAINAALEEANGYGLPRGYALEKTPDAWDSYDLFVAAWYWAHHNAPWAKPDLASEPVEDLVGDGDGDGATAATGTSAAAADGGGNEPAPAGLAPASITSPAPRIALRMGDNEDAVDDLLNSLYRHGLRDKEMGQMDAQAVIDTLQWRALYRKHHLMPAECESKGGIDGNGVNRLFREGKLAWAPIDQEDSLWLHGGARRDAEPGMAMAADLSWANLPAGSSLEMKNGQPARPGRSFSLEEIHLWAVPIHARHHKLAFELAKFLTGRSPQQRETEAQGLLPIRQDLRAEYPILFRLEWMQRMLDASYRQLARGTGRVPPSVALLGYDHKYTTLFGKVLGTPNLGVTQAAIRAAVKEASHGK